MQFDVIPKLQVSFTRHETFGVQTKLKSAMFEVQKWSTDRVFQLLRRTFAEIFYMLTNKNSKILAFWKSSRHCLLLYSFLSLIRAHVMPSELQLFIANLFFFFISKSECLLFVRKLFKNSERRKFYIRIKTVKYPIKSAVCKKRRSSWHSIQHVNCRCSPEEVCFQLRAVNKPLFLKSPTSFLQWERAIGWAVERDSFFSLLSLRSLFINFFCWIFDPVMKKRPIVPGHATGQARPDGNFPSCWRTQASASWAGYRQLRGQASRFS